MSRSQQLGLIIAAAVTIPLMVVVGLGALGIHADPFVVVAALVVLWAFRSGASSGGTTRRGNRGGGTDADEERRALAELQKKFADELIEEHRVGKISAERRNEQLRHILNAPPHDPKGPGAKGPGPRRPM